MSAPPKVHASVARSQELHEEIEWLASFGMTAERIAARLGLKIDTVQSHARGIRGGPPITIYTEPIIEPPVPSHTAYGPKRFR